MTRADLSALAAEVIAVVLTLERDRVESACMKLIEGLRGSQSTLSDRDAQNVLGLCVSSAFSG